MTGEGHSDFSEVYRGPQCPRCGSPTVPINIDDTLSFQCESNHNHTLDQLLEVASPTSEEALRELIRTWEETLDRLSQIGGRARSMGHVEAAEIIHRQTIKIEERIRKAERELLRATGRGKREPPSER